MANELKCFFFYLSVNAPTRPAMQYIACCVFFLDIQTRAVVKSDAYAITQRRNDHSGFDRCPGDRELHQRSTGLERKVTLAAEQTLAAAPTRQQVYRIDNQSAGYPGV